jgi:hypothetical protein
MEKKRIIVDYRNITQELLQLLTDTYPYGFEDDIFKFKNAQGEWIRTVPLETEDSRYLVKVNSGLEQKVEAFLDDEEDDNSSDIDETDLEIVEESDD